MNGTYDECRMLTATVTQTSDPVVMAEIRAALIHIHYVSE